MGIARSQAKSARVGIGLSEGGVAIATSSEGKTLPADIIWAGDDGNSRVSPVKHCGDKSLVNFTISNFYGNH